MTGPARAEVPIYSVGDLVGGLRALLEERVGRIWVMGEVSNLRRPASGHLYFTLKDDAGQIRAALFRGTARRLLFEPEDGLEVLVYADVTLYEARGELQLVVRELEPRGEGALQLAFEQLRRRLEAEGLFDDDRKRPVPEAPRRVGVVASASSAALRDVLQVTGRRAPGLPILVSPSPVQGAGAEREIAAALERVANQPDIDVVLLVRGGGSLEDLQSFNTEVVARAIAACLVPVVVGVGHEVDVTIADLCADLRAPTPSAAAELVAPDHIHLRHSLQRNWARLRRAAQAGTIRRDDRLARAGDAIGMLAPAQRIAGWRARLAGLARAVLRAGEAPLAQRTQLEALGRSLAIGARGSLQQGRARLGEGVASLEALSPLAVLSRGYALVRRQRDGEIVRTAAQLSPGERVDVRVAEAELEAVVFSTRPLRS